MAEKVFDQDYDTSQIDTINIAQTVEDDRIVAYNHRRIHERRWYDNNFFDDGFHFRYLSRTTNKIVDLSERATIYTPQRAIPKASRQIRGIANLLLSSDPTPTVYPEEVPPVQDQTIKQALEKHYVEVAQKRGYWLEEEWREADASGETLLEKLALAVILSTKHSVSYIKVWVDQYGNIRTGVRDAFDLYVIGSYNNLEDLPFLIEATPLLVSQIRSNPDFDEDARMKVLPDNKPAESEIKQAYMRARYGRDASSDQAGTAILYEAYLKEYLNENNLARIRTQKDAAIILKGKKEGDCIVRQVFAASGQVLRDTYLNMETYPYVDVRLEPGPLYSVPLIERFINANKSLDSAVSRMERYFHTMVTGIWLKQRGENFKINNIAGGQVIEWQNQKPEQADLASPGQWTFEFMNLLTNFIEEQGVSTTLGNIPTGVKAHAAIESLKEQEFANLIIAQRRIKEVCRRIALKMFAIADDHFVTPKSVSYTKGNQTNYFQVIGKNALSRRKGKKIDTPDNLVTLSKDTKVDIEIEQGMAYTREGKKASMQDLITTMLQYAEAGLVNPEALKPVIQKYLEIFQFGATAEFMEAFDSDAIGANASDEQLTKMKMALLQGLQETGLAQDIQAAAKPPQPKSLAESLSIAFKDLPEDTKADVIQALGFPRPDMLSPTAQDQAVKHAQAINTVEDNKREDRELDLKEAELHIKAKQASQKGGQNGSSK